MRGGATDAVFEADSLPSAMEASYASILGSVKADIDATFSGMLRGSFVSAPAVHVSVGSSKGAHVDMQRLTDDAMSYAASLVAGRNSFLQMHGDANPRPAPVLNIDMETA